MTITVSSNVSLGSPLSVNYIISGTNIAAADFSLTGTASQATNSLSGTLTIPAGNAGTSMALSLTALADADTDAETLRFAVGTGAGYTVSGSGGAVDIAIENQVVRIPQLFVTATSTNVAEGSSVTIVVRHDMAMLAAPLTVNYTISGVTAADFTLAGTTSQADNSLSGTLPIPAGTSTSRTLTLTVLEDADTNNEILRFAVVAGTGYTVSGTEGAVDIVITQPVIPPPDGGSLATVVSVAALRTFVDMGFAAGIDFRVETTNGWNCVEPVRYEISTDATSTDISGLQLSGRGVTGNGLTGEIPCGVIYRSGMTEASHDGPDLSCAACSFTASRHISLATDTGQDHFSSTVTVRLLPAGNGGYQLLPGADSTTVTVRNREYRPYTIIGVGNNADPRERMFTSILPGETSTINFKFQYLTAAIASTNRVAVPLLFRIDGEIPPAGSFILTEEGSSTPITVSTDNTFIRP
ncbi:MAG: hypothetical protein ACNYPG_05655 [Candidatus Porifericomitaceae bacterium WSBS_2022_MAG_OTU9]